MPRPTCTVVKATNKEQYSITAPNGEEGDLFDYGTLATVQEDDEIYLCFMDGPDDQVKVERVTETAVVAHTVEELDVVEDDDDEDETEVETLPV